LNARRDFGTSDWQLGYHYNLSLAETLLDNVAAHHGIRECSPGRNGTRSAYGRVPIIPMQAKTG